MQGTGFLHKDKTEETKGLESTQQNTGKEQKQLRKEKTKAKAQDFSNVAKQKQQWKGIERLRKNRKDESVAGAAKEECVAMKTFHISL